jgi:hypothetical protein
MSSLEYLCLTSYALAFLITKDPTLQNDRLRAYAERKNGLVQGCNNSVRHVVHSADSWVEELKRMMLLLAYQPPPRACAGASFRLHVVPNVQDKLHCSNSSYF